MSLRKFDRAKQLKQVLYRNGILDSLILYIYNPFNKHKDTLLAVYRWWLRNSVGKICFSKQPPVSPVSATPSNNCFQKSIVEHHVLWIQIPNNRCFSNMFFHTLALINIIVLRYATSRSSNEQMGTLLLGTPSHHLHISPRLEWIPLLQPCYTITLEIS